MDAGRAVREKALVAERIGAPVRIALMAIVAASYAFASEPSPWAWAIAVGGIGYATGIALVKPYERWRPLMASYATTALDSSFALAFILVTGGFGSPYFVLLYASVVGVAFRYDLDEAMTLAAMYAVMYAFVAWLSGAFPGELQLFLVEAGGILFIGAQAGLLAREAARQARDKISSMDQLEGAVAQLRENDEAKGRILNHLSHELKTPLTPMKLQLHMMRMPNADPLSARQQRALDLLERNLAQMERVTDAALDTTRVQMGRLRLQKVPCDVAELAREVAKRYQDAAARAGVDLRLEAPAQLPVTADIVRVRQVMSNLLSNALKFTPRGGHVQLRVHAEDGSAKVDVEDDGKGIAPADLARLFQPFGQLDENASGSEVGAGLSLYITRGIVEEHGGRVWVESPGKGRGAHFGFSLPA